MRWHQDPISTERTVRWHVVAAVLFWCVKYVDPTQSNISQNHHSQDCRRMLIRVIVVRARNGVGIAWRNRMFIFHLLAKPNQHTHIHAGKMERARESHPFANKRSGNYYSWSQVGTVSLRCSYIRSLPHRDTTDFRSPTAFRVCVRAFGSSNRSHLMRLCVCVCFGSRLHELFVRDRTSLEASVVVTPRCLHATANKYRTERKLISYTYCNWYTRTGAQTIF